MILTRRSSNTLISTALMTWRIILLPTGLINMLLYTSISIQLKIRSHVRTAFAVGLVASLCEVDEVIHVVVGLIDLMVGVEW